MKIKKSKNKASLNDEFSGESAKLRINSQHPNPNKQHSEDVYHQNKNCNVGKEVNETFRIDDNSNYSTTVIVENKCIDESMIPGLGLEEKKTEDESGLRMDK